MKRKPGKSTSVLKARRRRDRDGHRISVREIALLTGCELVEVKQRVYWLCPAAAFHASMEGKPIYLTWAEARKVLSRLFEDAADPGGASRIRCLDALLAREGPFREGCHVIDRDKAECKVTNEQVLPVKDFDRLFPHSEHQVCANAVLSLDSRQLREMVLAQIQAEFGRNK